MNYAEYRDSTDPNRFIDGCPCISCSDAKVRARNLVESMRTTINAERGLAPAPKLDLQGNPTTVDWRKNLEELLPFIPVPQVASSLGERGLKTAETLTGAVPDMQKNLRDYRESMGNPLPPADASPRPLSAVEAMQNNDAQQKSPDYLFRIIGFCDHGPYAHEKCIGCKNWIAVRGYKVGEERRKEGGYATLITGMEMLTTLYPEKFPETPEETQTRRNREWAEYCQVLKVVQTAQEEEKQQARIDYDKEKRARRDERLLIAAELELEMTKPSGARRSRRQTIEWLRSL